MRLAVNIASWLLSLLAASFVGGFFVMLGLCIGPFRFDILSSEYPLEEMFLYFSLGWIITTLHSFIYTLIPAFMISIATQARNKEAQPVMYGIAGALLGGIGPIAIEALYFEPNEMTSLKDVIWSYLHLGWSFLLAAIIGGYFAGREFAFLRNGKLRWR